MQLRTLLLTLVAVAGMACNVGTTSFNNDVPCEPACSGDTPVCDPQFGVCVGCYGDNSVCDAATPVCANFVSEGNAANFTCVECREDDDCAAGVCSTVLTCVECEEGSDCPGDEMCIQNLCGGCETNADCGEDNPVCDGDGMCQSCSTDTSACTGDTPACGPDGACVECVEDADCPTASPSCDSAANTCMPCAADLECPASAPSCNIGTCGACTSNADCDGRAGTTVCDASSGHCVGCTPATEAADCGDFSCDPATLTCSAFERGQQRDCERCVSDSDCLPGHACIATTFQGAANGAYCLPEAAGGCGGPYGGGVISAVSLSGAAEADYCGLDSSTTSCAAVRGFIDGNTCTESPCEGQGARCETVNGVLNACTYSCSSALQCPSGFGCSMGYCGG